MVSPSQSSQSSQSIDLSLIEKVKQLIQDKEAWVIVATDAALSELSEQLEEEGEESDHAPWLDETLRAYRLSIIPAPPIPLLCTMILIEKSATTATTIHRILSLYERRLSEIAPSDEVLYERDVALLGRSEGEQAFCLLALHKVMGIAVEEGLAEVAAEYCREQYVNGYADFDYDD